MNHFLNSRMNHKPRVRISLSPDLQLLICNICFFFFLVLNFFEVGPPFLWGKKVEFFCVCLLLFNIYHLFLATLGLGGCAQAFSSSLVVEGSRGGSDGKVSAHNVGDLGSIPVLGRSPGEGNGNPLQHSCLKNSMDWRAGYSPWGHKEPDMTEWRHSPFTIRREWGPLSSCRAQASHCGGFSCCGAQALGRGLSSCREGLHSAGSVVVALPSCPVTCGSFLDGRSNQRPLHYKADS